MNPHRHSSIAGRRYALLTFLLFAVAGARLLSLPLYPLTDTTEARYAEVARKMVELGDWVTPWFDYGVPFWAKPPLSTWLTAMSFKVFGLTEFAARLPHFLLGVAIAWLVCDWTRNRREASLTALLLAGSVLFWISAGAVMTDMAFTFGLVLAMRGYWQAISCTAGRWNIGLVAVGLAVGLLSKGPLALVLFLAPIGLWAVWRRNIGQVWRGFPWLRSLLLAVVLAAPWYILAERATPGFLEYFLLGEHWQRFLTPGWAGDRYGNAHEFPRGTIWLFAGVAMFPWTFVLPLLALRRSVLGLLDPQERSLRQYLLCFALAPALFFTLAGNILWTYALPMIPPAALLAARWLADDQRTRRIEKSVAFGAGFTAIGVLLVLGYGGWTDDWKSAESVVTAYQARHRPGEPLLFLRKLPYSASFYSRGSAKLIGGPQDLQGGTPAFVVLHENRFPEDASAIGTRWEFIGRYDRYVLLRVPALPRSMAAPETGHRGGIPSSPMRNAQG